jgi:hypothetical protein
MSLTVEMRPFFEEDKPDVYKEFMEDGFIGQGIFFDGQEFVSLSDLMFTVYFYVGNGIIKEFETRFGNFENTSGESVGDYGFTLNSSSDYKVFVHNTRTDTFMRVQGESCLNVTEKPEFRYTLGV